MSKLLVSFAQLGKLNDSKLHKQLMSCGAGPALAIWKRPVLEHRREVFMATCKHIETLSEDKLKNGDNPLLNGWKLAAITQGE